MVAAALTGLIVVLVVIVALLVALIVLVKVMWRVAEPDEALIVTGLGAGGRDVAAGDLGPTSNLGFKIVVGKGALVAPGLQTVRRLGLAAHKTDLRVECVTSQGIPVHVRGVVVYKVGDEFGEIANAARRFLAQEDQMDANVHEVFAGHLRSIVGSLTVEEIIRERSRLAEETRNSSAHEMQRLGLVIDSLQIQEVDDPSNYIANLAAPHQARVEAEARIAAAERNREATEKEMAAAALAAKAVSESEVEQARVRALANSEKSRAEQAGPLAAAESRKAVVVQETEVAQLQASLQEQRLQAETVKPAEAQRDARIAAAEAEAREVELRARANAERVKIEAAATAEQRRVMAEAEAGATERTGMAEARATEARGLAEAASVKAKLTAEAEGIEARAKALEQNQQAVIQQAIVEQLPETVRAAAEAYRGIDHMIVLNGAEGMNNITSQVLGTGLATLPLLQDLLNGNGRKKEDAAVRE